MFVMVDLSANLEGARGRQADARLKSGAAERSEPKLWPGWAVYSNTALLSIAERKYHSSSVTGSQNHPAGRWSVCLKCTKEFLNEGTDGNYNYASILLLRTQSLLWLDQVYAGSVFKGAQNGMFHITLPSDHMITQKNRRITFIQLADVFIQNTVQRLKVKGLKDPTLSAWWCRD